MATLGFGQDVGQVVQTAYVVKDVKAAMDWWIRDGKVGPWFLLDSFTGSEQRYRGERTSADVSIAMAFAGHMMIELIQPKDKQRSVYKEVIDQRGYHVAFSAPVPSGGTVYYMSGGAIAPGFIELIPATPGMDELFTRYWKASVGWKGDDPIRAFG